jgi:hypothetical protein
VQQANAQDRPIDWLIPGFLMQVLGLRAYELVPNLVQHLGSVSSFAGNRDRAAMRSSSFAE